LFNVLLNLVFLYWGPHWAEGGFTLWGILETQPQLNHIFLANTLASALTLLLIIPELRGIKEGLDPVLWRKMLVYALPLVLVGFAGMVNETFDRIILEYLLPPERAKYDMGVYGACYKLSILMSLFIQAFRFAAEPFFFSQA